MARNTRVEDSQRASITGYTNRAASVDTPRLGSVQWCSITALSAVEFPANVRMVLLDKMATTE